MGVTATQGATSSLIGDSSGFITRDSFGHPVDSELGALFYLAEWLLGVKGTNLLKGSKAVSWKGLSSERRRAVNAFMTKFGKGEKGARRLWEDIKKNGVPGGLDLEAFSAYANQIRNVGGNKAVTSSSEVFQLRVQILERILGG